jgi:hypothetical protein
LREPWGLQIYRPSVKVSRFRNCELILSPNSTGGTNASSQSTWFFEVHAAQDRTGVLGVSMARKRFGWKSDATHCGNRNSRTVSHERLGTTRCQRTKSVYKPGSEFPALRGNVTPCASTESCDGLQDCSLVVIAQRSPRKQNNVNCRGPTACIMTQLATCRALWSKSLNP